MFKIGTIQNYDFYIGINKNAEKYFNIVPSGQPKPAGGYYSHEYICNIKKVPNLFIDYLKIKL